MDEEAKFLSLLQGKNHKELIGILTKILEKLDKETPMEGVTNLLKEIATKPLDTEIPESIKAISKLIVEKLDIMASAYKNKPNKWKFDFVKDEDGGINHVIATGIQ